VDPAAEPDAGPGGKAHRPGRGDGGDEDRGAAAANGTGDLRRGLEVLADLLELSPRDRRLRRRKVRYARRLGDPGLLEEALVELGDLLDGQGAHRGARLLYEEAGSADAERDGARTVSGDEDVDEGFRRRLSEALERAPRELERLQAAGMEAVGAEGAGAVPWRAHRELGRYLLLRGRPDEAARHLAAARERAPAEGGEEAADVLYDLGLAHRRAGRSREARDCFRRLAERDPGFAVAWEALST
jgi:tetratricopeptide (TPR) repeat protein